MTNYDCWLLQVRTSCTYHQEQKYKTIYKEIKNNQNYEPAAQYAFPKENRLLHFLFEDAREAERLNVWKPLGEWLISRLRPERYPEYTSSLNLSSDGFDVECWEDPTFIVVRFFDLMVSAAEYQDVHWHMWLYYFQHFLQSLLKIYSEDGPGIDLCNERPTRAAWIINEMFQAMCDWISAVNHLPKNSSQLILKSDQLDYDNANIPKSAILALGTCLRDLLLAQNVNQRFKQTIIHLVISSIDKLPLNGPAIVFRRIMIASVVGGGLPRQPSNSVYIGALRVGFQAMDYVVRERLADVEAALATEA